MWNRVVKAWAIYRHVAAIKGLLEGIGAWKWIALGGAALVSAALAYWSHLSPWFQVLIGLIAFAAVLLIAGLAVVLYRAWDSDFSDGIDDTSQSTPELISGPVVVLEFPKKTLNVPIGEKDFMRLRNIGVRAAQRIRVAPLVYGTWRVDFEEIHALASSGHDGDSAILEYTVRDNGQHFSSSSHIGFPAHGLITFLELWGMIVRRPVTIEFYDGQQTRYTVQEIDYEWMHKTIRVRHGDPAKFFRSVPLIEQSAAADALNLTVTNTSPDDLEASKLLLHSIKRWDEQFHRFSEVPQFKGFSTVTLYGDQVGLPSGQTRRFQLLEFTNPAGPIFRARVESYGAKEWPIPSLGVWRMDLELRWQDGVPYIFRQCFKWDQCSAPNFVICPSEVKRQFASVGR